MTAKKVLTELKALGFDSDKSQADYDHINSFPKSQTLAKVTPLAGYYKANIFREKSKLTKTIPMFLPILFLCEKPDLVNHTLALPVKDDWKRTKREPRNDRKLSDKPEISTLPIYTYAK